MVLKSFKKIWFLALFVILALFFSIHDSKALYRASDRISTSHPGAASDHVIQFINKYEIPAGGKIVIDFDNDFVFESGLSYTDFDLAVADGIGGDFSDRSLAASSSALNDGVLVASSSRLIEIELNSSLGIEAGKYIKIEIGTVADYDSAGIRRLLNPPITDSFRILIETYGTAGEYIERTMISIVTVMPVSTSVVSRYRYFGGSPIGWLSYGTTETIMSLSTNYPARCRYASASGTPFATMTNDFSYSSSTAFYNSHTVLMENLSGGEYKYYIRCMDENGLSGSAHECLYSNASTTPYVNEDGEAILKLDCVDYYIPFSITSQAGDGEGDDTGTGGDNPDIDGDGSSSGGGSGGGGGGGGGGGIGAEPGNYLPFPPAPGAPGVVFEGYAYPNSEIHVLKDGVDFGMALANSAASFGAYLEVLNRGVYTFNLWSSDSEGRRSNSFSSTFWMEAGTQTTISGIILPPTLDSRSSSITAGQTLETFGYSVPNSTLEVWLYPEKNTEVSEAEILKKSGLVSENGTWSLFLNTDNLSDGPYLLKAKTAIETVGESGFSTIKKINIGASDIPQDSGTCAGADLNGDGRVNLTDFSILLYHWGTSNQCADQNQDGTVNLTDFSIMLYYWTG